MSGNGKSVDRKLSSLSRFGLRGRGRGASPNISTASKPATPGGSTPKRTFTPNIVSRTEKKEETPDTHHPQFKVRRGNNRGRGRGRGRGRDGNVIQSAGVFSQGIFSQPTLAKALGGGDYYGAGGGGGGGTGGGGSSGGSSISRIVKSEEGDDDGCIESDKIVEMMEEEGKLEMDDIKAGNLTPITLPLSSKIPITLKKEHVKIKKESIKKESIKEEDEKYKLKPTNAPPTIELADLFKSSTADGELLFFQFPDTLPIKPISEEEPIKTEESTETTDKKDNITDDITDHLKRFTFRNVSEGFIGKLCIHESGKVKMRLGNVSLDVTLGTPCGFLQDLVSVRTDREPAEMISLGHINHRLIGIPDYKALLGSVTT